MENFTEKFNIIEKYEQKDGSTKFIVSKYDLKNCLCHLKNSAEFAADMLLSIKATDWNDKIELTYELYSTKLNDRMVVSTCVDSGNPVAQSVVSVFKSAAYDEREIFDLFGVDFDGHEGIKRLLMPDSTVGNPMLRNADFKDERLAWNE